MKKDNMPEHCQIPDGSHIEAADASEIDKIREELGITPPAPAKVKPEAVPEHCQIPKGSHIDSADAAQIEKIRQELGIAQPDAVQAKPEAVPEHCQIPKGSYIDSADAAQIEKIRQELGIAQPDAVQAKPEETPEHCQIPKGSHIDSADAAQIEKIRQELGITPPAPAQAKAETVPEHCQIPKGSHIDSADAAKIREIQEELGISAPKAEASAETQPQACEIPKGSKISGVDSSQISKIQEELGITPQTNQAKTLPDTIDAQTVLRELGDDTDNPMFITVDDKIAQSDLLGKDEARAIAESLHPDHPQAIEITVMKDGPYIVSGPVPLREAMIRANEKGESIGWYFSQSEDVGNHYALCRCGHSAHMPFCDGAHEHCHWDGTCTASTKPYAEAAKIYQAADGCYLMDQENLCAIVRYCDPDGSCWNLVQKAKTLPEGIRESLSCASGRLTVVKDGKLVEPKFDPEIDLIDDRPRGKMGPLWVKGGIPVKTQDGTQYEVRNRVTLCRCGNSRNKPFCDGCHLVSDDPDNAPMPTAPADPDALRAVSSVSQPEEKTEK